MLSPPPTPASALSPPLSPEAIADNIVFALDVHEKTLRDLRTNPEELWQLTRDSIRTPLQGYTAVPHALEERDEFFAVMKALCDRVPTTGFE